MLLVVSHSRRGMNDSHLLVAVVFYLAVDSCMALFLAIMLVFANMDLFYYILLVCL